MIFSPGFGTAMDDGIGELLNSRRGGGGEKGNGARAKSKRRVF